MKAHAINDNDPRPGYTRRGDVLPKSLAPRGLRREQAAAYIGISPAKFDECVAEGSMPKPKRSLGVPLWDRDRLDEAFEALPDEASRNPWDDDQK